MSINPFNGGMSGFAVSTTYRDRVWREIFISYLEETAFPHDTTAACHQT